MLVVEWFTSKCRDFVRDPAAVDANSTRFGDAFAVFEGENGAVFVEAQEFGEFALLIHRCFSEGGRRYMDIGDTEHRTQNLAQNT